MANVIFLNDNRPREMLEIIYEFVGLICLPVVLSQILKGQLTIITKNILSQ